MAKLSLGSALDGTIQIDGQIIALKIKRADINEFIEFEQKFLKYGTPDKGFDDLAADDPKVVQRAHELAKWLTDTISEWVTLPEGEIDFEGRPVTTGAELVRLYAGRHLLLMQIVTTIWSQNKLPEQVKNKLGSLSDFPPISSEPPQEPVGRRPEPTAVSAEPQGSASIEGATEAHPSEE